MRIIHTADLHLGQVIYQHYEREDEHSHFFRQLKDWIAGFEPDALIVSGDIFDVQQPSAAIWNSFTSAFVDLRQTFPKLHIVIVGGNHDSASRLQSHSKVWGLSMVSLIGTPPPPDPAKAPDGWEERYIVRIPTGYIIALPYMSGERTDTAVHLQKYIAKENVSDLPVVMTGHLAVTGSDTEGHDFDIGTLRSVDISHFGCGYDYLALGHIHKPQTLGHPKDVYESTVSYPAPVARYSGSVLHVSGDEAYPHSVSLVDIDRHGGKVEICQLRIDQLCHFHILPPEGEPAFESEKEILKGLKSFIKDNGHCYVRLKISTKAKLPADFNSKVYNLLEESGHDIRYNPKMLLVSPPEEDSKTHCGRHEIEVSELQQMGSPLAFVRMTIDRYPDLDGIDLNAVFTEIEDELKKIGDQ